MQLTYAARSIHLHCVQYVMAILGSVTGVSATGLEFSCVGFGVVIAPWKR